MLTELDRIAVIAVERAPVVERYQRLLGAELVREDQVAVWGAARSVLRLGRSEVEVLEADGVGTVAQTLGRKGPGLFAAGFAAPDLAPLRAHLDRQGVLYDEEDGRLFLTGDRGVDLPGLRLVLGPSETRQPAGLVQRLFEASLLVEDHEAEAKKLAQLLALDPGGFQTLSSQAYEISGTLAMLREDALDRMAVLTPWNLTTPAGRFLQRRGPCLYMAFGETDDLEALRSRLEGAARGGWRTARGDEGEESLFVHPRTLGGLLLGVCRTSAAWAWSGQPERVVPPVLAEES